MSNLLRTVLSVLLTQELSLGQLEFILGNFKVIGGSEKMLEVDVAKHIGELRSNILIWLLLLSQPKLTLLALFNHCIFPVVGRTGPKPIDLASLRTLLLGLGLVHGLHVLRNGSLHGVLDAAACLFDFLSKKFFNLVLLVGVHLLLVRALGQSGGCHVWVLSVLLVRK